jgi:hypothetical protein
MCVINLENDPGLKFFHKSIKDQKRQGGARPLYFEMPVKAFREFKNPNGETIALSAGGFTQEEAMDNLRQIAEQYHFSL